MKKTLSFIPYLAMLLSFSACSVNKGAGSGEDNKDKVRKDTTLTVKRVTKNEWTERRTPPKEDPYWIKRSVNVVVLSDDSAFKEKLDGRYEVGDKVHTSKIDPEAWLP